MTETSKCILILYNPAAILPRVKYIQKQNPVNAATSHQIACLNWQKYEKYKSENTNGWKYILYVVRILADVRREHRKGQQTTIICYFIHTSTYNRSSLDANV